jgi:hypothetical protein
MSQGSLPGEHRGGRQHGTPSRRTAEVMQRLADLGCICAAGPRGAAKGIRPLPPMAQVVSESRQARLGSPSDTMA